MRPLPMRSRPMWTQTNQPMLACLLPRRTKKATSDFNVVVVGTMCFAEIVTTIDPAQDMIDRDVNPTVYPVEIFRPHCEWDTIGFLRC